jgi:glycine/D-amino acid oxidase-like deaminating enzyme
MPSSKRADVAIIGGGIVGTLAAVAAADRGLATVVIDQHPDLFHGASRAGFGSLTPYSDPFFIGEARDFAARGTNLYREELLPRLAADVGLKVHFADHGLLEILDSAADLVDAQTLLADLAVSGYGDEGELLDRATALELEPNLAPNFEHALLLNEPWLDTEQLFNALRTLVAKMPAITLLLGTTATHVEGTDGDWSVVTDRGQRVRTASVVVATGVATQPLGDIPAPNLHWVRGDAVEVQSIDRINLLRRHIYRGRGFITPRSDGRLLLGATYEQEPEVPHRALAAREQISVAQLLSVIDANLRIVPKINECDLTRTWRGWRPTSTDKIPIIGPHFHETIVYATGCIGLGITMAPAVAEGVVEGLVSGIWSQIPSSFSPLRPGALAVNAEARSASVDA